MTERRPVTLAARIDLTRHCWFLAAVDADAAVHPLLRCAPGTLERWQTGTDDERISFLRHRIAGTFQLGATRLFQRGEKAGCFAVVFAESVSSTSLRSPDAASRDRRVVEGVARHFCLWMIRPPVFCCRQEPDGSLQTLDSTVEADDLPVLKHSLAVLNRLTDSDELWEYVSQPSP